MNIQKQETLKKLIEQAKSDIGLAQLREFGIQNGFLNNYFRKQAWPLLLEIDRHPQDFEWVDRTFKCKQYEQIVKDVNRSMNTLDIFDQKQLKEQNQKILREQLLDVLDTIFKDRPNFSYYQGYHDIVTIFMFVLGTDDGYYFSLKAADKYFKDLLEEPFELSVLPLLSIIKKILHEYCLIVNDKQFIEILEQVPYLSFPVPWLLTWFSHSVNKFTDILRIWDFLLSSSSYSILYLCCGFILYHKPKLNNEDLDDMGEMMATLQYYFQHISDKENDIESIIKLTQELQQALPFEEFCKNKELGVSANSVLYEKNHIQRFCYLKELNDYRNSKYGQLKLKLKQYKFRRLLEPIFMLGISYTLNKYLLR